MTKKAIASNRRYLITPSLLNSWAYIWNCVDNIQEKESDEICLEDKKAEAQEKALQDFLKTLNREPIEPNFFMKQGIEFEDECYQGKTCVSPIIKGGAYQIVGTKNVNIDGINFLLYGRLDVLKGGIIYDIKRVMKYTPQKYFKSYQHGFYFELFDDAYEFQYLVYDGKELHIETYYRDQCVDLKQVIREFMKWLSDNGLLKLYFDKWVSKY